MDTSRLAELLKGAKEDYSQLSDAYPNAAKFVNALRGNIEQNVPTQADLQNPQAMADWSQAAALNAPMGLTTKFAKAHEIAQRNAALPIEKGGLGLSPSNTAMDRAKAMGFDTGLYHGRYKDYESIKNGKTFYATPDADYASLYAFEPTASSMGGKSLSDFEDLRPNIMPVMIRSGDILDTRTKSGKDLFNKQFFMKYGNGTPLTEKGLPDWVDAEDFGEMFADIGSKYKGVLADEGKIPTWEGGIKDRGISHAIFEPSAVRSRFAAFDPMQINSPNLLAGGALGALLLNQEYNKDKP